MLDTQYSMCSKPEHSLRTHIVYAYKAIETIVNSNKINREN